MCVDGGTGSCEGGGAGAGSSAVELVLELEPGMTTGTESGMVVDFGSLGSPPPEALAAVLGVVQWGRWNTLCRP